MESFLPSLFTTIFQDIFLRGTVGLLLEGQFRLFAVLVLIIFSVAVRQIIIILGQNWVKTFSHTLTIILLPIVTYVITSVISSNIALALGMIGASWIIGCRKFKHSIFTVLFYPLSITLIITLGLHSIVTYLFRATDWKKRTIKGRRIRL